MSIGMTLPVLAVFCRDLRFVSRKRREHSSIAKYLLLLGHWFCFFLVSFLAADRIFSLCLRLVPSRGEAASSASLSAKEEMISPLEEIKGLYIIYGSRLHLLLVDQVDFNVRPMLGNSPVSVGNLDELILLDGLVFGDVLYLFERIGIISEFFLAQQA